MDKVKLNKEKNIERKIQATIQHSRITITLSPSKIWKDRSKAL